MRSRLIASQGREVIPLPRAARLTLNAAEQHRVCAQIFWIGGAQRHGGAHDLDRDRIEIGEKGFTRSARY
jgi:hypothetical protein